MINLLALPLFFNAKLLRRRIVFDFLKNACRGSVEVSYTEFILLISRVPTNFSKRKQQTFLKKKKKTVVFLVIAADIWALFLFPLPVKFYQQNFFHIVRLL